MTPVIMVPHADSSSKAKGLNSLSKVLKPLLRLSCKSLVLPIQPLLDGRWIWVIFVSRVGREGELNSGWKVSLLPMAARRDEENVCFVWFWLCSQIISYQRRKGKGVWSVFMFIWLLSCISDSCEQILCQVMSPSSQACFRLCVLHLMQGTTIKWIKFSTHFAPIANLDIQYFPICPWLLDLIYLCRFSRTSPTSLGSLPTLSCSSFN